MQTKIPKREFIRKLYCFDRKCLDLTLHTLFYLEWDIKNGEVYYKFSRKCYKCNRWYTQELRERDFEALILNRYY